MAETPDKVLNIFSTCMCSTWSCSRMPHTALPAVHLRRQYTGKELHIQGQSRGAANFGLSEYIWHTHVITPQQQIGTAAYNCLHHAARKSHHETSICSVFSVRKQSPMVILLMSDFVPAAGRPAQHSNCMTLTLQSLFASWPQLRQVSTQLKRSRCIPVKADLAFLKPLSYCSRYSVCQQVQDAFWVCRCLGICNAAQH